MIFAQHAVRSPFNREPEHGEVAFDRAIREGYPHVTTQGQ
jgi:hypothetical protein